MPWKKVTPAGHNLSARQPIIYRRISAAQPGESVVYHTGGRLPAANSGGARLAYEDGLCALVQRRLSTGAASEFQFIAQRSNK